MESGVVNMVNGRPSKTQTPGGSAGHSGRTKPKKGNNSGIIAQPIASGGVGGTPTKSKNSSYKHGR